MAKQGKGIMDGISGKVGSVVGINYYSKSYLRSLGRGGARNNNFTYKPVLFTPVNYQFTNVGFGTLIRDSSYSGQLAWAYVPQFINNTILTIEFRVLFGAAGFEVWFGKWNDFVKQYNTKARFAFTFDDCRFNYPDAQVDAISRDKNRNFYKLVLFPSKVLIYDSELGVDYSLIYSKKLDLSFIEMVSLNPTNSNFGVEGLKFGSPSSTPKLI